MFIIGENIHVISPRVRTAIETRDTAFMQSLAKRQADAGASAIDLNIGPQRKQGVQVMEWLVPAVQEAVGIQISLDTTNVAAMEAGLKATNGSAIINSVSAEPARKAAMFPLARDHNADLIALALTEQGIPPDASDRAAVVMDLMTVAEEHGISTERIYFDPLVLPVSADQYSAVQTIEGIRMFKQLSDPPLKTVIGLSNVSNGSPNEIRPLINRVYLVLAMAVGLDAVIADPLDKDLREFVRIVEHRDESTAVGKLLVKLVDRIAEMEELEASDVDMSDPAQVGVYKTVQILRNRTLYAHSYLQV